LDKLPLLFFGGVDSRICPSDAWNQVAPYGLTAEDVDFPDEIEYFSVANEVAEVFDGLLKHGYTFALGASRLHSPALRGVIAQCSVEWWIRPITSQQRALRIPLSTKRS
jgi:hypothetical protein